MMNSKRTRETQKIIVESIDNPYHSSYIPLIHQECNTEYDEYETRTTPNLALHLSHQSCSYITDRACSLLNDHYTAVQCWGLHYPPCSTVTRHFHRGYDYTFVYYISVPNNTPLIFDDFQYDPRERDLIVFSASLYHKVNPVHYDRYVIAGNLKYKKVINKGESQNITKNID